MGNIHIAAIAPPTLVQHSPHNNAHQQQHPMHYNPYYPPPHAAHSYSSPNAHNGYYSPNADKRRQSKSDDQKYAHMQDKEEEKKQNAEEEKANGNNVPRVVQYGMRRRGPAAPANQ